MFVEKTPTELRSMASQCLRQMQESFDRCDSDGFLSQMASDTMARLYTRQAEILENGGAAFVGLYEGDRRVMAKTINTKFGTSWLLRDDEAEKFGRKFLPFGPRSKIHKALGLREAWEYAPARAKIGGNGRDVVSYRTGAEWGEDATLTGAE